MNWNENFSEENSLCFTASKAALLPGNFTREKML